MIKCIVFDWYGVCAKKPWRVTFSDDLGKELNIDSEIVMESFRKFAHDYEKDIIDRYKFIESVLKDLNYNGDFSKFNYLIEAQPEIDWWVIDLIKILKQKFKIILFSDNYVDVVKKISSDLKDLKIYFDDCLFSCDLKMRKTEIGMYKLLVKKSNVNPKDMIFIDDQEKNFKFAKDLGIKCILYKDYEHLVNELNNNGIDIKPQA